MDVKKICLIGAGYVGGPTGAVMALKCPQIQVTIVDVNEKRIAQWLTDNLPIHEPGLLEVIKQTRGHNLYFSTNIEKAIDNADMIFLCVNTPSKTSGHGANSATDMSYIETAVRNIARYSRSRKIIVEKSTVPVKTSEHIKSILKANSKTNFSFQVLSNPEIMSESTAVQDLIDPNFVMIGGDNTERGGQAIEALAHIYKQWVPADRIILVNSTSAELAKLARNAMGAQKVSSINALAIMCEATGADITEVRNVLTSCSIIGTKHLTPSLGFGGSCYRKDILSLVYIAETLKLPEVANYWNQIILLNDYQRKRFVQRIINCMLNNLTHKAIAIFGFAYKKNTGDTRDSSAIVVAKELITEGALVRVYDPSVIGTDITQEMVHACDNTEQVKRQLRICSSAYEAAEGCHAVVICTEWDEFQEFDYKYIYEKMERPAWIFDGRKILNGKALEDIGFSVHTIGKFLSSL